MNLYIDNIIFSLQNHGGISVVWYELLKRMLVDSDFTIKFFDYKNKNLLRTQLNIPASDIISDNLSFLPFKLQRYINPTVNAEKGIFHSSYFRIAADQNLLNVTTVHDFTYEYFFKGLPRIIHHQQKGNAIAHSKKIICVSQNTKDDLLKFYPRIKEDKIEVVYNGVSEDYCLLSPTDNQLINLSIPFESKEYILYIGDRRSNYKNFRMLVDACQIANMPLVIVGGGILTKVEKSMLEIKLGKTQFIQLTGMSNIQLNLLYNNAFFFVYPSLYEGFGIPILEAQKAGCPVICSNQSSIPEVAGNGAFIIENINAIKIADILLFNKSSSIHTKSIIEAGFINARRFSWDKCYQQTKLIYSNLYAIY